MSEVEDVAGPAGRAAKDVARAFAYQLRRAEQDGRVQVALDAPVVTDSLPAGVERNAPVERHDVRPSRRNRLGPRCGVLPEMDPRPPRGPPAIQNRPGLR